MIKWEYPELDKREVDDFLNMIFSNIQGTNVPQQLSVPPMPSIQSFIITASEAKEMADKQMNDWIIEELEKVMKSIKSAIKSGSYYISESGYLSQATKDKLQELGYKVEAGSQYNEAYYTVSWK